MTTGARQILTRISVHAGLIKTVGVPDVSPRLRDLAIEIQGLRILRLDLGGVAEFDTGLIEIAGGQPFLPALQVTVEAGAGAAAPTERPRHRHHEETGQQRNGTLVFHEAAKLKSRG